MVTRLKRDGNRFVLVIDQPLLDQLRIDAETPLEVAVAGNTLVVTPLPEGDQRRARFEAAKKDTFERYDDVFRRLAE
jgi:antitoxin component of MazEF toxin-antitoxin module